MRYPLLGLVALALAAPAGAETFTEVGEDYILETTVVSEPTTLYATKCKKVSATYTKTNGGGNDLYKVSQKWGWCWNTNTEKVTSLYGWERWKNCCDPFWQWVGWEATTTTGWTGNFTVTRRIEGHTKFCVPFVGCPDHDYPWVKLFLYGNGGWNVRKGSG
jgi:hypothetical protein